MQYEWSSELESGHTVIDAQHKALFAAVNAFAEAVQKGKGSAEIEKTLLFLVAYTDQHFHDEEQLQIEHKFPYYDRHRQVHQDFKSKVQVFVDRFQNEGPSIPLLHEIYVAVGDWLLHHIKSDDFLLAAYIRDPE